MADPELSLQSILMVAAVIGRTKTFSYVALVALFSICADLIYGARVDGLHWDRVALGLAIIFALLGMALAWLRRRQR